ncbi:MAG: hypothetical protein ABJN36_06530 [Cyclobacteriaceae bacterium]|uniref:hypothetical protein n=1 Tax=Nonlabens ulvanivorans TaxID=906888 RepID=UPI00329127E3
MKNKWNLIWVVVAYLVLVAIVTTLIGFFRSGDEFFFHFAASIIISWIMVLIIYYIWAIYFYNINLGWDDEDWERVRNHKDKHDLGPGQVSDEPMSNPHAGETLGLPPGTVRGTIALSLLIAGLAVIIASFQLNSSYASNENVVDNFEFFKNAFLMMIAFYFGNKSLEVLNNKKKEQSPPPGSTTGQPTTFPPSPVSAGDLKKGLQQNIDESDESKDFNDKQSVG